MLVIPGLSEYEQDVLSVQEASISSRLFRNKMRTDRYDGKHFARHVGTVAERYRLLGLCLGWPAKAVDTLARRVNLNGFSWGGGDLDGLGSGALLAESQFMQELNRGITSSMIHGVSFLAATAGGGGEPPVLVHSYPATDATCLLDPRTRRVTSFMAVTSRSASGDPTGIILMTPGVVREMFKVDGRWVVEAPVSHGFGVPVQPLVYRARTGRPFGQSRLTRPVLGLHDAALRVLTRMEGHADIFSSPQMILLGASPDAFTEQAWATTLGGIKALDDDMERAQSGQAQLARAQVQMFQAASQQPHLEHLKQIAAMFSGETSIPLASLGISDMSNPTSAESYIASREDLISEAEGAMDDYDAPVSRLWATALGMAHSDPGLAGELVSMRPVWRSPIHISRAAEADAGAKIMGAAPWLAETAVGLRRLGLSDAEIEEARAEKRRRDGLSMVSSLLARGESPDVIDAGDDAGEPVE